MKQFRPHSKAKLTDKSGSSQKTETLGLHPDKRIAAGDTTLVIGDGGTSRSESSRMRDDPDAPVLFP